MTVSERKNAATFIQHTTVKPFFYQQANFKCFYCEEIFPDVVGVLQHINLHEVPERVTLLSKHLIKGKRVIKVDISDLKCKICEKKYSDLDQIRQHLNTAHRKEFNSAGNGLIAYDLSVNNGKFSCHKCEKSFNSFYLLNRHMNAHYNVVCETCGLGFMSNQRLVNHRIIHENGEYPCNKCLAVFQTKLKLRYHIDKKHDIGNVKKRNPLKCPHCPERFAEHYKKMNHLKDVHGISFTFECQTCKAEFPTRRALTEHNTKIHTQKIQCKECLRCFATKFLLSTHIRSHSRVRSFHCDVCQKAFMHKRTLRTHMRAHVHGLNAAPANETDGVSTRIACTECGNDFYNMEDIMKHMKQWHSHQQ